ncbi:ribonuclease E domain protein [Burkholderia pseudomallei]|nr:ribonuclease E domain protein [Burkholderia pseudomallei]
MTQALELVVRRIEVLVRNQHDADLEARFDLVDFLALFVEQEGRHLDGHLTVDRRGVLLHRFFLNDPQHLQRGRFGVADVARAVAARAGDVAAFGQGRAQALARQLHQAEARDLAHLHARAVVLERVLQALLDFALALGRFHVDEVDHDQAAQVAQT